jgi:hypothetical protein
MPQQNDPRLTAINRLADGIDEVAQLIAQDSPARRQSTEHDDKSPNEQN